MSRSYRKHPYSKARSGTCRWSERYWKTRNNRENRRDESVKLHMLKIMSLEDMDDVSFKFKNVEFGDVWDSITDGKATYFGHYASCRCEYSMYWSFQYYESELTTIRSPISESSNFPKYILERINEINHDVKNYGYYQYWSKRVYKLTQTYEERVKENNDDYKRMMRK